MKPFDYNKYVKTNPLLKEADEQMFADLVDEIVEKANSKSAEYNWTAIVLKDHGITDEFKIQGLQQYAIDTNHHRIAEACEDILSSKVDLNESPSDTRFNHQPANSSILDAVKRALSSINQQALSKSTANLVLQNEIKINEDKDIVITFYSKPRK